MRFLALEKKINELEETINEANLFYLFVVVFLNSEKPGMHNGLLLFGGGKFGKLYATYPRIF